MEKANFEKVVAYIKVSREIIVGRDADDFITDQLTCQLYAYVLSVAQEKGKIVAYTEAPSFLDWLLRRRIKVEVSYEIAQLMKHDKISGSLPVIKFPEVY